MSERSQLLLTGYGCCGQTFRGFHGQYEVIAILSDGQRKVLALHLRDNDGNHWTFKLQQ